MIAWVKARQAATLLTVVLGTTLCAQPATMPRTVPRDIAAAGLDAAALDRARDVLEQSVRDQQIAGAVAAVARHGVIQWTATVGVQDLTLRTPMTVNTIFRIYSMTKPITAVAVMMLHEQGRFQLDDPVSKYLPKFAAVRVEAADGRTRAPVRAITIRDLLLHTSGLNHRTSDEYRAAGVRDRAFTLPRFVSNVVAVPLKEDPGTRFRYSEATTVLGRLVEVWSGQPFERYLDERILKPLAMEHTGFVVKPGDEKWLATVYAPSYGRGLTRIEVETIPFTEPPQLIEGAVGLVSTVPDFWRFAQMLLDRGVHGGVRLLKAETVDQMVANGLPPAVLAARREGIMGWGLGNVDVVMTPERVRYPASRGEYGWDGTAGTIFWSDAGKDMVTLLMTQSQPANPERLRERFKTAVEQAVIR